MPEGWDQLVKEYQNHDFPLILGFCGEGFFGNLRRLMGEMNLFTGYYDHPELIEHMNGYFAELWISLWDEAPRVVKPDAAWFFEDMCYRNGPLISPALFREIMSPHYRAITRFLDDHGVGVRIVDTDGNCWELIPEFLDVGITGMLPFEVASGMDVVQVRERFPRLQIFGGLDKQAVAAGRKAIDAELASKLHAMGRRGGYVPCLDHLVPPNVSWDDFRYYRDRLRQYTCGSRRG